MVGLLQAVEEPASCVFLGGAGWLGAASDDVEAVDECESDVFGVVCEDAGLPLDFAGRYLVLAFDDEGAFGDSGTFGDAVFDEVVSFLDADVVGVSYPVGFVVSVSL